MRDAGPLGRFLADRVPAVLQFGAGALMMAGFLAQRDLVLRTVEFIAFLLLARLTGRRLRLLSYLVVSAGIVAFNLLIPVGRELFSILKFPVTESALKSGVAKALTLVGMIAASQFSIRPDLRIPGRFGGLLARSLMYFQLIVAERRRIDRRDVIGSIDEVLIGVHGAGAVLLDDVPAVPVKASGILVLVGVACLTWVPLAATLAAGRAPFWGAMMRLPFDAAALVRIAFDRRAWTAWWKALRPASLVIALVSCGLGAALAWRDGRGDAVATVLVLAAGMVLQAGVNLVNDFFEFKQRRVDDKIAHLGMFGPERQLVEWFIFLTGLACFAAVVPAGLYLAWRSGWPFAALGAAGLVGGYAYTGEPLNYKRRGLGVPLVFFLMGVLLVAGSYYAVARTLTVRVVMASLPISALVSLILLSNELRDYEPDSRHGIRTLTVRVGYRASSVLYLVLLASAYLGTGAVALAEHAPQLLIAAAALPFAVPPTLLVFAPHERRQGIIPRVMLHHLVFGGLSTAAFLIPFSRGSA